MYRELVEAIESLNIDPDEVPRLGIIGGEDENGNYAINVIDEPNKVYIQFIDGLGQPQTEAINFGVPLIPDFPVLVYYRNKEAYAVIDPDRSIYFRSQNEGLSNVAPHSHEPGLGNFDLVSTRRMKEGIVTVTLPYSMSVDVEGFKFLNPTTGEERWFPGGALDVGGYVPSTTDSHRWVKVGFDPFVEELVAASGVEVPSPVFLSETELAEIPFENWQSLAGIELYNTVTAIDDDKLILDWRFFLNTIVTGVGGGDASGVDVTELADLSDVLSATQTANWVLAVGDGVIGGLIRARALVTNDIPSLDAAKISTGIFNVARIPDLDAAKITTGTLGLSRIPNLPASQITTGVLVHERGGVEADVSAYEGLVAIFSGATENIKYNRTAITDPTATDDNTLGYRPSSIWINVIAELVWMCIDNASSNAIWVELTTGGSGNTITVQDDGGGTIVANTDTLIFPQSTVFNTGGGTATYVPRLLFYAVKLDGVTSFNSSGTPVIFTSELLDTDGYADLGSDDDRFTIPSSDLAGWYEVTITGTFLDIDGNLDTGWATFTTTHNGPNTAFFYAADFDFATASTFNYAPGFSFSQLLNMSNGDYITISIDPNTALAGDLYVYLIIYAKKVGEP